MPENRITKWHNCYDDGWQGIIVPEAFAHPAKMSYGLLKRILAHAKEQGWLNGVIVDPFGGIGSTGILGAYEGCQVVCCELEQKFVDLAEQNFKLHDIAWQKFGNPRPIILQGDSRRLCEVVEKADCMIGSPPFMEAQKGGGISALMRGEGKYRSTLNSLPRNCYQPSEQGHTPGQLGAMKPGKVDMVVSSPPFLQGDKVQARSGFGPGWRKVPFNERMDKCPIDGKYGNSKGNLGNLKSGDVDAIISSPPYAEALSARGGRQMAQMGIGNAKAGKDDKSKDAIGYSDNPNNLGNLKSGDVDCVLGSPPYEKRDKEGKGKHRERSIVKYSDNQENIGNQQGDTFWQAAKIIVEQCYQILKPGGHAIWVVKSFVRNKAIVDFPSDWQRLCESVSFKTVCIHHAMLVKETKHQTLFGHTEVKRTERKSFFRRLAESKGSPRIDFEVVLCMEK